MGSARAIRWCSTMADAPRMDHKQLRRAKKLIRKDLRKLMRYAQMFRVEKLLRQYLEVLL